jgi:hypothetical protein
MLNVFPEEDDGVGEVHHPGGQLRRGLANPHRTEGYPDQVRI